ncbi:MAG TPA: AraC family transcriptional regulator [Gammaproteobacteria bacterium]|nr:AraC family transcriptional regulator [Gammaproteobacteria bacterium]
MTGLIFSFRDMAVLTSAFIGLLIGLFLYRSNAGNRSSNRVLALFLLVQSVSTVLSVLLYSPVAVKFSPPVMVSMLTAEGNSIVLEGFLLYWYTRTLLFKGFAWGREIHPHLAAILIIALIGACVMNLQDVENLIDLSVVTEGEARIIAVYAMMQIARNIYAGLCFINLRRYRRLLEDRYSNIGKVDFTWLQLLVIAYLVSRVGWSLTPLMIVFWHYNGETAAPLAKVLPFYAPFLDTVWLFALSATLYFALQYSPRFEGLKQKAALTPQEKSGIKREHIDKVEGYMRRHKPYLQADLKLDDLAEKLSISPKALSILLNVHYGKNFCEFINHHRVGEAASMLSDPVLKEKGVLEIAMEVGFHSKSAFNRSFKKQTGLTPLEYRQGAPGNGIEA